MRFAWLTEQPGYSPGPKSLSGTLIFVLYNLVYWAPLVLLLTGDLDYGPAFIVFTVINAVRLVANVYRVNVLAPSQGEFFPLRAP